MYKICLKLAGAQVLLFEKFKSYRGDWLSLVKYNGRKGWVNGYCGSCLGCDDFRNEFGSAGNHLCYDGYVKNVYDYSLFCQDCKDCNLLLKRLKIFGKEYLDQMMTQKEAELKLSKNIDWDLEVPTILNFLKENSIGEK